MKPRDFILKWFCAWGRVTPAFVCLLFARQAQANPTGMTVVSGSATALNSGSQLSITTSRSAVLNWSSFNIASGEKTVFNQPSVNSVVVNNIGGQSASQIYGSLQANGIVVLLNSSGFYFGPNSFVSAAGLVVSTASFTPPQNSGGAWEFNGPPPLASIVNYGQIKIGNGGDCFFIADQIENHGTVEADGGGSVQFAAGQTVTLSERPDGRGMSMQVALPKGSVDNYGNIVADGGTIALSAKVVNQDGLIQADSVQNNHGVIELVAADSLNLGANSQILARGDDSAGGSAGGDVTLQSQNDFSDAAGSQIVTTGGANGGNGGNVEISAPNMAAVNSTINGSAQAGFTGGTLLIDPTSITLDTSGSGSAGSGTVAAGSNPSTLDLNVNAAFIGLSAITLQAKNDITLADGTTWNLSATTGLNAGQLTLEAGGNVNIGDGAIIKDANAWNVMLEAGYNFINNTVNKGAGNILFNGGGALQLGSGLVNLIAGDNITVNTGYVITTGGGGIYAHALAGTIDTGSDAQGYTFNASATTLATAYNLNSGLGGISTAAGGNVTLIAGTDVNSLDPVAGGYDYLGNFTANNNISAATAGAGAYGSHAGNVTVIAGGDITGHYVEANGTGNIFAGVTMDANGNPVSNGSGGYVLGTTGNAGVDLNKNSLSLSLVSGGWNVTAANNINLTEVNNPNGDYNTSGAFKNYFNYAPSDFVDLNALNGVSLGGNASTIRRSSGLTVPVIYPGILDINAGAGGVTFTALGSATFGELILFPSPLGSLVIDTTGGGALTGSMPALNGAPQIFQLILSDSSATQFKTSTTFGISDHAATPIHLDSEEPVDLNISGSMSLFSLYSSEAATINVLGDMNNCRFQGMNLSAADTSTINVGETAKTAMENNGVLTAATDGSLTVGGEITDNSAFTTISLSGLTTPDLSVLGRAVNDSLSAITLADAFYYNPSTQTLTYQNINGQSLASVLSLLQNLTVQEVDAGGNLLWQDSQHTIPLTEQVSVLSPAVATALTAAYQPLPVDEGPLAIGGGGTFRINADDIDLGTTAGIISYGVGLYNVRGSYPLAQLFNTGANIVVDAAGNLTMPSSSIASFNGGDIYVNAAGSIDVGSSDFNVTSTGARGIYATGLGNVAVYAGSDIDVEGSRIAVYDTRPLESGTPAPGGSLTVVSRNGNVIVGSGGSGSVVLSSYFVDPSTHQISIQTPTIPGTGILQTSFNRNGNVLIEALAGDVTIGTGGITQTLFKGNQTGINLDQVGTLLRLALEDADSQASAYEEQINGVIPGLIPPIIDVYAGYGLQMLDSGNNPILDAFGNPVISALDLSSGTLVENFAGANIDATGSGIVGAGTANLKATGGITGNIISFGDVNLAANNNIAVNVFGLGTVNVDSASGSVSGTIVGVGGINASGSSVTADLESNAGITGGSSGGSGFAASQSANNVSAGIGNDVNNAAAKPTENTTDDEVNKKKKPVALAQKVSRVTVLLPVKN
ncbi:MAG TPA: filamentous hemagglutinin N-terminal domain-containing protein [Candidatus Sulfotelmatobacter sp.]|jgi:filamentous hemagglutinin family protein|nr:filamentous hemagglutinin N-terminal domain-containing protein [Candidatus Sulfotelmatobacter sp.]